MPTVTGVAAGSLTISGATVTGTRAVSGVAVGSLTINLAQVGIPGDVVLNARLLNSPFSAQVIQ